MKGQGGMPRQIPEVDWQDRVEGHFQLHLVEKMQPHPRRIRLVDLEAQEKQLARHTFF